MLLCQAINVLAEHCPPRFDDLWMTDATPVPGGMSRETVKRSDLAGHAGYGYCASHSRYYWGLKLYLVCTGDGMPIREVPRDIGTFPAGTRARKGPTDEGCP